MDPRRARDPRLARADPRLQRLSSGSPAPPPTPPQVTPQHQQQWMENGIQNYSTPPPSQFTGQLTPHQQPAQQPSTVSTLPAQVLSTPEYKQRPLFCIVCASNQVIFAIFWVTLRLTHVQNRSMEGHHVLA